MVALVDFGKRAPRTGTTCLRTTIVDQAKQVKTGDKYAHTYTCYHIKSSGIWKGA